MPSLAEKSSSSDLPYGVPHHRGTPFTILTKTSIRKISPIKKPKTKTINYLPTLARLLTSQPKAAEILDEHSLGPETTTINTIEENGYDFTVTSPITIRFFHLKQPQNKQKHPANSRTDQMRGVLHTRTD